MTPLPRYRIRHIPEFPRDGDPWLLTAVGPFKAPHHGGRQRVLDVTLVQAPRNVLADRFKTVKQLLRAIGGDRADRYRCTVEVDQLPRLIVGTVFQGGKASGSVFADPLNIYLRVQTQPRLPHNITGLGPYDCIFKIYDGDTAILVVPQSEIFRAFYGFTPEVAAAITGGPWELTWRTLGRAWSARTRDDSFSLTKSMGNGNLMERFRHLVASPEGFVHANTVYDALLHAVGPIFPDVDIPFSAQQLRVRARTLPLDARRQYWLLSEIDEVHWPYRFRLPSDPLPPGPPEHVKGPILFWGNMPPMGAARTQSSISRR